VWFSGSPHRNPNPDVMPSRGSFFYPPGGQGHVRRHGPADRLPGAEAQEEVGRSTSHPPHPKFWFRGSRGIHRWIPDQFILCVVQDLEGINKLRM